ncbi:Hypothetical predicted protein [Mytilus galloprovincialis]|uniref:Ig-like domain-containing protein n=1 Tax=Mytilus galloprovincialis TaxID=29158 RepID=A0A8B6EKX4_MYTGA|nr:Hypothetical predicted protein [Mytilus galloprovincialis]
MRFINCVMLLNYLVSVSPCTFPPYMTGSWSDSKFYDVQFSGGTHMYLSGYSISRAETTTNLTCYMAEDNKFVVRTTESVTAHISGVSGQYYYYLCMEITQITDYSFYYYLQSGEDTNNERTIAVIDHTSDNSISTFCQTPISLHQFHIMVKNGHELEALQTCSSPMLGAFQFELSSTDFCTSETNSGNWAYDSGDETFSSLNITYSTTSCDVKVGHSENSNVGCLLCIQTSNTYITSIINLDTNINNQLYYKFTCMVINDHDGNVTISQRARVCHKDQTADTMPDITPVYPVTIPVVGAVLNLAPNGDSTSIPIEASCFPQQESTSSSPAESSSNTVVIAIVVVVILLLVIVGIVAFIYWWKKIKGRVRVKNQALPRNRRFLFDIRTALTVGMGSSRKREKSFVQQNGSDILIVHKSVEDKLMTGETEMYNSERSPVSASSGSHCDEKNHGRNGTLLSTIEKGSSLLQGSEKEKSDISEITSISVVQISENSSPELMENMKSSNDNNLQTTMVEPIISLAQQKDAEEGGNNSQNTKTSEVKTSENISPTHELQRLSTQDQIKNVNSSIDKDDTLPTTMVEQILPFSQEHDKKGSENSKNISTSVEKTSEKTLPAPELQRLPTQDQMINAKSSNDNNDTLPSTVVEPILHFSQQEHDEKGSDNSKNINESVEMTFQNISPTPELNRLPTQNQKGNVKNSNDNSDSVPTTVVEPILYFSQQKHDDRGSEKSKNISISEEMTFENISPISELKKLPKQNQKENVKSSNDVRDTLPTTMVEQTVPFSQQGGEKGNNISENNTRSVVQTFENTLTSPELQGIRTPDQIQNTKHSNDNSKTLHTTMVEQLVPFTMQRNKEGDDNFQNIVEISSKDLTFENTLQAPTHDQLKHVKSSDTTINIPFCNSIDAKNNQSKNVDEEGVTKRYRELMTNEPQNLFVTEKLKPRDSNNGTERLRDIENRGMQFDQRLTNSAEKANIEVYVKETSINKKQPQHIDSKTIDMNRDYSDSNDCSAIASSNQPSLTLVNDTNNHKNDDLTTIHQNVSKIPKELSQQPTVHSNSDQTVTAYGNDVKDRRNQKAESNGVLSFRTETMRKTGDYIWNIETKPHFIKSTISLDQTQVKKSSIANQSLQNQKKKKVRKELLKKKSPYNSITFIRK